MTSKAANRKRKNKPDRRGYRAPPPQKVREGQRQRDARGENPRQPLDVIFCPVNDCVNTASNTIAMIRDGRRVVVYRCREHTHEMHDVMFGPGPL